MLTGERPYVSFTFDDFPRSAYRVGGSILARHGVRGTYYVALGLEGSTSELGPLFTPDDLAALLADGHELGCHTFGHLDAQVTSTHAFAESLARNRLELGRLLPGAEFTTFAYPFGRVTIGTKRVARRAFRCARTTTGGLNTGTIDLAMLRSNRLRSRDRPLPRLAALIRDNAERPGWFIVHSHDVSDDPSPYGCTPAELDAVLRGALDSRATVLPVREVLASIYGTKM
jgi:peptidoglycan/xylan/chitin deacetylase (PgdA/CDA1 family)